MQSLDKERELLLGHPLYHNLKDLSSLKVFMSHHVFCVWDFMNILKALYFKVNPPGETWTPASIGTESIRFLNEIVLAEESDLDSLGRPQSHLEIYLQAMEQVGASKKLFLDFLQKQDVTSLETPLKNFISYHLELLKGNAIELAGAFFYGREEIIPCLFEKICEEGSFPQKKTDLFAFYLKRHIELDKDEHGPMGEKILQTLCPNSQALGLAQEVGRESLRLRRELWDWVNFKINLPKSESRINL